MSKRLQRTAELIFPWELGQPLLVSKLESARREEAQDMGGSHFDGCGWRLVAQREMEGERGQIGKKLVCCRGNEDLVKN